ncbi:NAD(P)-binding protein [Teratosphaeria nubilosa]|uniref:NAD(P)-binding protein n=1 Tax=Teratosphaeria nubilosa TaxID=161662 RepID=A0A6G1LDL9_9PEZI|nr:NAD(P)-binding protein [Teratosphaeria nubilosa]
MPLTILGDSDVNRILHSFDRDDILELQTALADALHWYSTSNDENECCSDFQPERTVVKRKDGSTSLFMPASSLTSQGIKVVNITPPDTDGLPTFTQQLSLGSDTSSSPRNSISTTASGESTSGPSAQSSTQSSADSIGTGQTSVSSGPSVPKDCSAKSTIRGSLTLMDKMGNTTGLINAEEVTAFRTALCSTMVLRKRQSVHDLTVFGAGKQAYWHIRLAMLLRPGEIHHLNIITRNFDTARSCMLRIYDPQPDDPTYDNQVGQRYNSKTKTSILTPGHTEYTRLLKEYVRASNVIFCTTPSTTPLFPASYLTNPEGRKKGRYIACIGSYKPHMIELHPDVLRYAVAPHHEHRHFHKRQKEGGAVIVDTLSGCLKEAGEVVQAKLSPDQVVELGELFMLKREAERRGRERGEEGEKGCQFQEKGGMREWITRGDVIYKSVGLGLMDVVVGDLLVERARQKGMGTTVENF